MADLLLIQEILIRPIFNLLIIFLRLFEGNLGIAIVLLTVVVRLLMIKQTSAGNDMQKWMSDLQPRLQEIQEKYKDDPQKMSQETMKAFKGGGKWPLKGCLMMLIQIPVFIGVYFIVRFISDPASGGIPTDWLYSFFEGFGSIYMWPNALDTTINTNFFGLDLLSKNNIGLTIFAAVFTFLQMKLTMIAKPPTPQVPGSKAPDMSKMMWFMNIFMVFMIGSVVYSWQAGIGLYIGTTTLFSVIQYSIQYRAVIKVKWIELLSKFK